MHKILIYGSGGWIGQQLCNYLDSIGRDYIRGMARLDNLEEVEEEITKIKEQKEIRIICLTGRTHGTIDGKVYGTIDYLEQKGKLYENVRDNLFCQVSLSLLCIKLNIHLSVIATGCIFTYDEAHTIPSSTEQKENKGFLEEDKPNFFDSGYSVVKGFTDRLLHQLPVCNMRIRMPITSQKNSRNFITKIVNYEKICSMPNSMTVLDDFIPIMVKLSDMKFVGTINLTNPGVISHNEILEMYQELVDSDFTWKNFSYKEQIKILAAGRSNNYLDTSLLKSLFPDVPDIRSSIRNVLLNYK